ncbi:HAMP domain-containing histidine kinase [Neorhizobium sp. BETTINA12A]|uniref:sensor histidine kinase n=1 Tax=Neorhizobium sp. BETTINA12A TaxID=2908924 RepID=UPI001FF1479F|nr:HAMP domain-containing sensor histidine kinase [Neorhizobium sp. BETTINA12A]MCJ9751181.1 HAMP domain-containing histidine kinase [Neorhizobium sp. BETTINA12A]
MSHLEIGFPAQSGLPPSVPNALVTGGPADPLPGTVHDLGNLIQVAASALNILSRSPYLEVDPSLPPIVASAKMSLVRAGTLVDQTMRRAREGETQVESVCIAACLTELQAMVESIWRREVRVDLHVDSDLPSLKCSRINLQCAIMNLLTNAFDAMPNGGTISLAARRVGDYGSSAIEITVVDSGLGMSPHTLQHAFEPFFTTRATGLGGFGLPMVKRFVEDVGGCVAIESNLGAGTRVVINLPIAERL